MDGEPIQQEPASLAMKRRLLQSGLRSRCERRSCIPVDHGILTSVAGVKANNGNRQKELRADMHAIGDRLTVSWTKTAVARLKQESVRPTNSPRGTLWKAYQLRNMDGKPIQQKPASLAMKRRLLQSGLRSRCERRSCIPVDHGILMSVAGVEANNGNRQKELRADMHAIGDRLTVSWTKTAVARLKQESVRPTNSPRGTLWKAYQQLRNMDGEPIQQEPTRANWKGFAWS
ncbi:expressed unknown protein [Ectocarpus siliculosus]|uniref:Uncharacterized protein n=1 Tax=Ectocarpus siliculosus TaxID=2880 RepID=D7G8B7_ECTSI|nr:expressed unknown protein [Ectocarpus siliculosus]|eukprot:CBJ27969.1 expressed unknown protein [Ectocarpus siliculosus]